MPHRVLHQRLEREHRHDRLQHLGVDLHAHAQPLAEARLLEPQVLLHVAQLVGHRHVCALARERIADELRELGQQLARLLRARVDEGGDGGERVVDEVRRDLGAQRTQLGAREPLALRLHLAQLDHRRHQRGGLAHHAGLLEPQPAGAVVERHQRPDAAIAGRPAAPRSPSAAGSPAARSAAAARPARGRRARRRRAAPAGRPAGGGRRRARRTPAAARRRPARSAGADQHAQVGRRRSGRSGHQASPQVRQKRRGGVHRGLHRRARRVLHPRRAHESPARGQRGRERQTQHHPQRDVHPRRRA